MDSKSNHLGYRVEDYVKDALKAAMEQRLYTLQYFLYTLALNRYLSLRVDQPLFGAELATGQTGLRSNKSA